MSWIKGAYDRTFQNEWNNHKTGLIRNTHDKKLVRCKKVTASEFLTEKENYSACIVKLNARRTKHMDLYDKSYTYKLNRNFLNLL